MTITIGTSPNRYQEELPKKISARGKDAHLTHDELVQCMKWKMTVSLQYAVYLLIKFSFFSRLTTIVKFNRYIYQYLISIVSMRDEQLTQTFV